MDHSIDAGDDDKEEAGGKAAQQDAGETLHGPKHSPLLGEDDVAVAHGGVAGA